MSSIVPSTNRSKSSWLRETTPGVIPASPVWNEAFVTANQLKLTPVRGRSKDIRSDGQAGGTFLTDLSSGGSVPVELKFKHWDSFLESAIKSRFTRKAYRDNNGTADSKITAVTASSDTYTVLNEGQAFAAGLLVLPSGFGQAGNNAMFRAQSGTSSTSVVAPSAPGLTDETVPPANAVLQAVGFEGAEDDITATASGLASTLLDFTTLGIQVGEWQFVGGAASGNQFATAANRGWARVSAIAANALTYDVLPSGWGVDDGEGKSIQVFFGDFAKNGTTVDSYAWERQQLDISQPTYEYFKGEFLNNLTLQIPGGKEIDMTMEFLGLGGTVPSTTRFAGSTDKSAPTYGTMTAAANIGVLSEGGASVMGAGNIMSAGSIKIANNISREVVPGALGESAINVGALMVSGNVDTYFGDGSYLAKGANDTASSFSTMFRYATGNREGYRFDLPYIKLTPDSDIAGQNQARKIAGPFEAEPHPALGYTISIGRFWYLPSGA